MGLLFLVIFGAVCAALAANKGRNPVGWFFIGFFFPLIGIIVILVIPNLKEDRAYKTSIEQENRRLREQVRQEQIKAESFRSHTQRRLDAHDQKLAIDTRADDNVLTGAVPATSLLGAGAPAEPGNEPPFAAAVESMPSTGWYYAIDGQTLGPVGASQMVQMIRSKAIAGNTLVWIEGMPDWTPASRVPEFSSLVNA